MSEKLIEAELNSKIATKAQATTPPPYSPEERATIDRALKERKKIAPAPRMKVENNKISVDHPDRAIGYLLMQNALGTVDDAFMHGLLDQLAGASSGGSEVDEAALNFMVSVIKGIEPRDQLESMLGAQMAAIHMATMKFAGQLGQVENLPQQDSAQRAFNQLVRTFVTQMEALKRYRSGDEQQKVTVQHVSVSEGGQAIVGNVTQNPRETASEKAPLSPPALTHSKVPAMEIVGEPPRQATPVKRKSST
jgi:hypothetical protein